MDRFYYETTPLVNGWNYAVFDRQASGDQVIASCRDVMFAQWIVDALNTRARVVDSVNR